MGAVIITVATLIFLYSAFSRTMKFIELRASLKATTIETKKEETNEKVSSDIISK